MLRLEDGLVFNGKFYSPGVYKIVRKEGRYYWVRKGKDVFRVATGFTLMKGKS